MIDQQIKSLIQSGDASKAVALAFTTYDRKLTAYLRAQFPSPLVDDIAAEIWTQLIGTLREFEGNELWPWLKTFARYRGLEKMRKQGVVAEAESGLVATSNPGFSERVQATELQIKARLLTIAVNLLDSPLELRLIRSLTQSQVGHQARQEAVGFVGSDEGFRKRVYDVRTKIETWCSKLRVQPEATLRLLDTFARAFQPAQQRLWLGLAKSTGATADVIERWFVGLEQRSRGHVNEWQSRPTVYIAERVEAADLPLLEHVFAAHREAAAPLWAKVAASVGGEVAAVRTECVGVLTQTCTPRGKWFIEGA